MTVAVARSPNALQDNVEAYVQHLEVLERVFNEHAAETNLGARISVRDAVAMARNGMILDRIGSFFNREDDSGVLHDAQLRTAIDCIHRMLEQPGENGVVLGAMQSGKTTTSLALQLAGPIVYTLTGRRIYPIYLMTSHTSQEDQTNIELMHFLNYYGLIKIEREGDGMPLDLDPGFVMSPTINYYRGQVLRGALGDIHMGPRLEDFIHRRVQGQRLGQIADLCARANAQGFESLLMIDEPQYGASDRIVVNDNGDEEIRPCILVQIFQAIEEVIGEGRHSFIGLSATPYEVHELESVWVVRQYLTPAYRGFNFFGRRTISDDVEIVPPTTLGFSDLAARFELPAFADISMAAYGGTPARFAVFARQTGYTGTQAQYQQGVRDVVRTAILRMVREANGQPIGICLRPFNNNARSADFLRQLDLESGGVEVIGYYGADYSGRSVKRAIGDRLHPEQPFVIVVTNRARMGDAFPASVQWFIDFAARASDLNALLQGLLGRACGYNKNSTVVLSDDNASLVADYRRTMGGYFYKTSRHSVVAGGFRRGAPTNLVRVRADMDDNVVREFFTRINNEIVPEHIIQDRPKLDTTRTRGGFRVGPILRVAREVGLFDHLETPDVAAALFPTIPGGFQIVRPGQQARHSRDSRMLGYTMIGDDCRFTFRWTSGEGSHTGVASRGYGARDATDRARAADGLEPQIHMEKINPETGEVVFDKRETDQISGNWRPYMVTLPLLEPVRELQEGLASYPNARSAYRRLMSSEEEEIAGFND
jgi:hypothetical protein